jgi:hypothetical protein
MRPEGTVQPYIKKEVHLTVKSFAGKKDMDISEAYTEILTAGFKALGIQP